MDPIADLIARSEPSDYNPPPPEPQRKPQLVTLGQLDPGHHPLVAQAIEAARSWAGRKRSGHNDASLVLLGPYGTGKTHIARAILWSMTQAAVDEDGQPIDGTARPMGRFFVANALIQSLDGNTFASNLVGNAPIVVIDDVGAEQNIQYISAEAQQYEIQNRYFKIINHCYEWQVSLVLTSNLGFDEFQATIGGRSWSRLSQMAPAGYVVSLEGVPDYRLKESGR